jgi:hypothetical protein
MHTDCTKAGRLRVESDNWLCLDHFMERSNRPEIRALNDAEEDRQEYLEFLDDGGKPS